MCAFNKLSHQISAEGSYQESRSCVDMLHMGLGWGRRNIEKKKQFSLTPSEFCH